MKGKNLKSELYFDIPNKFKDDTVLILAPASNNYLWIYKKTGWDKMILKCKMLFEEKNEDPSQYIRTLTSGSVEIAVGDNGKIIIPEFFANYAGIKSSKDILVSEINGRLVLKSKTYSNTDK